jgi:ribosomal protein L11 methyltransferase
MKLSMNSYYQMEIAFDEGSYDIIYTRLYTEGVTSILEENGIIKICLDENMLAALNRIKTHLIETDKIEPGKILINRFDNQDWNKEWEKTIEPVLIKDKIIIYPSWKKKSLKDTGDKILIEIDPKMSFGTGHNETTQLILELMSDYIDGNDKYMLDFGCGTGILAIAGIKLGLEKAVAIDIDLDSVENAREYFRENNVADSIVLYRKDISEITENNFDIISANITSNVIIPNLKNIYNKLKPKGKLFITGILTEEEDNLTDELKKNGFDSKDIRRKGEWSGFYAVKN